MISCPVCKREFHDTGTRKSRRCPLCGSTLVHTPDGSSPPHSGRDHPKTTRKD